MQHAAARTAATMAALACSGSRAFQGFEAHDLSDDPLNASIIRGPAVKQAAGQVFKRHVAAHADAFASLHCDDQFSDTQVYGHLKSSKNRRPPVKKHY